MDELNSDIQRTYKFQILGEISFENKDQTINLLCSRFLGRHILRSKIHCSESTTSTKEKCSSIQEQFSNLCTDESQPIISERDECLNIQEQLVNVSESANESQQHSEWYAYWEKYGEDFVNETWIKQYGSCLPEDLPTDLEQFYKEHTEKQYNILYWKFVNEMNINDTENKEHDNKSETEESWCSESNEELDNIPNYNFLYKFKHFQELNEKLVEAYKAISIMGYTYDDQNIFESASVTYLKNHILKSTHRLNIYRFPKTREPLNSDKSLVGNSNKKIKKAIKLKKWKQKIDDRVVEELEKFGYSYLNDNPKLMKYWKKRHLLFSEFEKGIRLDEESWYSVTPEFLSSHIAERCSCYLIVDPFCGAGGNIIQFAMTCELVIAIDHDPKKIELARHNAELYGVADRIQFIIGDYYTLAPTLKADVVFLSPPWGGPELMNFDEYKLSFVMPENGGVNHMLSLARQITSNIAIHLPKNTNIFDCLTLADDGFVEVQQNVLNSRYNSLTVYFGELYGLCDDN